MRNATLRRPRAGLTMLDMGLDLQVTPNTEGCLKSIRNLVNDKEVCLGEGQDFAVCR